jgi:mono/diheme cytochrome c family protein
MTRLPHRNQRGHSLGIALCVAIWLAATCKLTAANSDAMSQFRKEVQPLLAEYCYDCHADGAKKGNVAFDELKSPESLLDHELWLKVLRNVRAGLMPPDKKPKPTAAEREKPLLA